MRARRAAVWATIIAVVLVSGSLAGCSAMNEITSDEYRGDVAIAPGAPVEEQEAPSTDGGAMTYGDEGAGVDAAAVSDANRLVIRSKMMRIEVESTSDTVESIRDLAKTHNGIITQLQVATDDESPIYRYDEYGYSVGDGSALRGWVTVRVPAETFEAFVDDVIALGTVKYQAEDSDDVTQQHVDLSARLANLQAEEARLREFFDSAVKVEEMLAIEAELARVRGEIESLDAQVKYLERQAAMATVTIEITEPKAVVRPEGDSWGFSDAITSGFRGAAEVVKFVIAVGIATAPIWVVGILAFFAIRAVIRARHRKHTRGTDAAPGMDAAPAPTAQPLETDAPGVGPSDGDA